MDEDILKVIHILKLNILECDKYQTRQQALKHREGALLTICMLCGIYEFRVLLCDSLNVILFSQFYCSLNVLPFFKIKEVLLVANNYIIAIQSLQDHSRHLYCQDIYSLRIIKKNYKTSYIMTQQTSKHNIVFSSVLHHKNNWTVRKAVLQK